MVLTVFTRFFFLGLYTCFLTDGTTLDSTLERDGLRFACPDTMVTFTCTVEEARRLEWVADPFISESNPVTFLTSNVPGTLRVEDPFTANLTEVSPVNLLRANLTSDLSIENVNASVFGNTVVIQCTDQETTATSNLTVAGELSNGDNY